MAARRVVCVMNDRFLPVKDSHIYFSHNKHDTDRMYNMISGYNRACVYFMPMLGILRTEYPRFRDCYLSDDKIVIFTRTGGGNRDDYEEQNNTLAAHPNYIRDYDADFDSTYANFEFSVPDKWRDDYDKIVAGKFTQVSNEYKAEVIRCLALSDDKADPMIYFSADVEIPSIDQTVFVVTPEQKFEAVMASLQSK